MREGDLLVHHPYVSFATSVERFVEQAVAARPAYLGLVGSAKRGAAVLGYLTDRGVPREQLDRVKVPAGLDLGSTSHQEIAVAILAELVQARAAGNLRGPALAGTAVPVPAPVAICADADVIGAPFYLMQYVDGQVLRSEQDGAQLSAEQAGQLSAALAAMLASIHAVDLDAVGLAGFGKADGYLARQLARWQRQWELSNSRPVPGYDRLVERLAAGLPASAEGTLVHGDFRLDNTLVTLGARPAIAAVVDWEMSTLGDPLADLGLTLSYWADPGDSEWLRMNVGAAVTALPGFDSPGQFAARYAELTGRDVSGIGYYMAFGCFKLAVVLEGIHARFLQHQTVGEGFEREGPAVPMLIERAHQMLDSSPLDQARN